MILPLWQIQPGQLRRWFSGCRLSPEKRGETITDRDHQGPPVSIHIIPLLSQCCWILAGSFCIVTLFENSHDISWYVIVIAAIGRCYSTSTEPLSSRNTRRLQGKSDIMFGTLAILRKLNCCRWLRLRGSWSILMVTWYVIKLHKVNNRHTLSADCVDVNPVVDVAPLSYWLCSFQVNGQSELSLDASYIWWPPGNRTSSWRLWWTPGALTARGRWRKRIFQKKAPYLFTTCK